MAHAASAYRGLAHPILNPENLDLILDQTGLNWEVCEFPVEYTGRNGRKTMPSRKVLVRCDTDQELEVVSSTFQTHQNRDIAAGLVSVAGAAGVKLTEGGSFEGGSRIFLSGELDRQFDASGAKKLGDMVQLRYVVTGGHKPGTPMTMKAEGRRLTCLNGQTVSAGACTVRVTHTQKLTTADLARIRAFVEATSAGFTRYEEQAVKLMGTVIPREVNEAFVLELLTDGVLGKVMEETTKRKLTGAQILEAVMDRAEGGFLSPKQLAANAGDWTPTAQRIMQVVNTQPGADMARGTMWNALNAVTYFVDHQRGSNADTAMADAVFGEGDRLKRSALDLAVEWTEQLQAIRGQA